MSCNYSANERAARGVCILTQKNMPIKVSEAQADAQGNLIKLRVEYDGEEICLYNIYGPNDDSPDFFQDIFD